MVEDNTNAFVKVVHRASDDMVETGKAIISKANEYIDFAADVISDVVKRSISAIKTIIKKKIEEACKKLATTKEDVKEQREKVKQLRATYKKSRHSKHSQTAAFKTLVHEVGVLNGMEQILAVKNIFKLLRDFFMGAKNLLLPDLLVLGTSYTSTAAHAAGAELILDFRTREVGAFTFGGINVGTNQLRLQMGGSLYMGIGWQHAMWCMHLEDKYAGLFRTLDASASIPGITELPGFASVSVGGAIGISAGGLGVLSHCCPLRDYVKTVSFTVSASIGFGLPIGVNTGCTDYQMKKTGNSCSGTLTAFLKDMFVANKLASTVQLLSPVNALLSLGLALANDHRAVPEHQFCNSPSPQKCACRGLPKAIGCCGDRKCHNCDMLGIGRLFEQKKYAAASRQWYEDAKALFKSKDKVKLYTHIFGHSKSSICERHPRLNIGDFSSDIQYMRKIFNVPKSKYTKDNYYDKAFGEAVIELKKKHDIPYEHRLRYTLDIPFWKKICLIERSRFLETKKCHRGRGVCVDSSRSSCSRRFLKHKCPGSHHIKCCTGHTTLKTSTKGNE